MIQWAINVMIFLGSALMIYNIYGFIRYTQYIRGRANWGNESRILNIPIILLVLFFMGYVAVGLFGVPDLIVSGILFGGSIFVFVMYKMLNNITQRIIEREHLEAELLAAEESNRAKMNFLASMSHEMRTPMNVILGLDVLALKNPRLSMETRMQLEKIGQSGRHLLDLINNILDLNSIESGLMKVENDEFFLADVLKQINAIAHTLCDNKKLNYHFYVSVGAEDLYVGDEMLLKQALLAILDNAVKYTDAPGKVVFTVDCMPGSKNADIRNIRFVISDTGIGMSEEFLEKAFEPFAKEDESATNPYGGSGVGLAATKSKIELLGGTISATSKKNEGSSFTVMIPLKLAEMTDRISAGAKKKMPTGAAAVLQSQSGEPQSDGQNAISGGDAIDGTRYGVIQVDAIDASYHEGDVSFQNNGEGSFQERNVDEAEQEPYLYPGGESGVLEGCRILIVEDIEANAEIVADLLDLEGAESEHAENGQIALEMFTQSPDGYYDAILMDLRMPVMDGHTATRNIRSLDRSDARSVPIIALTANAFESDIQHSMEVGMDEHLVKPIDPDQLYEELRRRIRK